MSTTYRPYNKKLRTKHEVGLDFIKLTPNDFDKGLTTETGSVKIGTYDKKEADKVVKIIEKVLELTQIRSNILR